MQRNLPAQDAHPHLHSAAYVRSTSPLHRLYNHDIMHCTADGVSGNHLYSARALGITSEGDIIQLSPELRSEWQEICAHYARVGLEHTHEVIWDTSLEHFPRHPECEPSVFFFGEHENRSHRDPAWLEVVDFINSKNNFVTLAKQLGVPIPRTHCFDQVAEIDEETARSFQYPNYLKAAISVSGVGIYRCENPQQLLATRYLFKPSTPVQVQEEVIAKSFLNMQYEVVNGQCRRLLTTEQILEGTAHQGNRCPVEYAPWEVVEPMAEWMAERGFKDVFAFDVAAIKENEHTTRYLAIECNPRYNGASYPTAIARKLDIPEWEARNFKTWHKSLTEVDLSGLEYDAGSGEGAVIVNWGPIKVGKLMILLAGGHRARERLAMELTRRLW